MGPTRDGRLLQIHGVEEQQQWEKGDASSSTDSQNELESHWHTKIEYAKAEESRLSDRLEHWDRLWATRQRHLMGELRNLRALRAEDKAQLESIQKQPVVEEPRRPGPVYLQWVDDAAFTQICTAIILLNLITIVLELWEGSLTVSFWMLDQLFLIFYSLELIFRWALHKQSFLFGKILVVWWNWLDLFIVLSGAIEQWMPHLWPASKPPQNTFNPNNGFRALRLLRLFRVMRILKIVKVFVHSDLKWAEGTRFQSFITGVIFLNAIVLGLELDVIWGGWIWLEQCMLFIYFFELAVRMKAHGLGFFVHAEEWGWNNLDFAIVSSGVFEQWMLPIRSGIESVVTGEPWVSHSYGSLMPLLRILRLLRVLRLVRLLKMFSPLYKLTLGILEAFQGMQWVVVLTFVLLYGCSILFRSLVGHGLIYGGHVTQEARIMFGSVLESIFLLFRVMNGDSTVMEPVLTSTPLKLLYVMFLVMSNWAILAILTAVVTDTMFRSTKAHEKVEALETEKATLISSRKRLMTLFREIDKDGNGCLSHREFHEALDDNVFREELCDAAGLKDDDLKELFSFLCHQHTDGHWRIDYQDFIAKLELESKDVCERSVFRLEKQMNLLEQRIDAKLQNVRGVVGRPGGRRLNFEQMDLMLPDNEDYPIHLTTGELRGMTNHFVVSDRHPTK